MTPGLLKVECEEQLNPSKRNWGTQRSALFEDFAADDHALDL